MYFNSLSLSIVVIRYYTFLLKKTTMTKRMDGMVDRHLTNPEFMVVLNTYIDAPAWLACH